MKLRRLLAQGALAAAVAGSTLVMTAGSASAYVVCNRWGECWRSYHRYRYPASLGIVMHPDGWYRRHGYYYHYRHRHPYYWRGHHGGRGYWRGGVWITF